MRRSNKTRKLKRVLKAEQKPAQDLFKCINHYCPDLTKWLREVEDPRHASYITYETDGLIFLPILKNICRCNSMRQMTEDFNEVDFIENFENYLKCNNDEIPHYVTVNDFFKRLNPEELSRVILKMIKTLIKKRTFEESRFLDRYWTIAFDGTGLYSFKERHCEHCLTRKHKFEEIDEDGNKTEVERTVYYHNVLEAKIIFHENVVLSIGTEFIENESEGVTKQDCELRAFYRLAPRIKKQYPRLPICMLGDSLYSNQTVFQMCADYNWVYLLNFKEGSIPYIANEFDALSALDNHSDKHKIIRPGVKRSDKEATIEKSEIEQKCGDFFTWVNDINYNGHVVSKLHYQCIKEEEKKNNKGEKEVKIIKQTFNWITNIKIKKSKVEQFVATGRDRWKIENEGFNTQKNLRYDIQHLNSKEPNALKCHYLIVQIADILLQLYTASTKILRILKQTYKKISSDISEALRKTLLTPEDMIQITKRTSMHFG